MQSRWWIFLHHYFWLQEIGISLIEIWVWMVTDGERKQFNLGEENAEVACLEELLTWEIERLKWLEYFSYKWNLTMISDLEKAHISYTTGNFVSLLINWII